MSANEGFPYSAAVPDILDLAPYQPGKPTEELERELGVQNAVKLASNENPAGPADILGGCRTEELSTRCAGRNVSNESWCDEFIGVGRSIGCRGGTGPGGGHSAAGTPAAPDGAGGVAEPERDLGFR